MQGINPWGFFCTSTTHCQSISTFEYETVTERFPTLPSKGIHYFTQTKFLEMSRKEATHLLTIIVDYLQKMEIV
jgi:hypothetical protein